MRKRFFVGFLLVLLITFPGIDWSTDYYVATNGNNSTGNGTINLPWATVTKACSVITAGDTVYFRAGTYDQFWHSSVFTTPSGSSWSVPITFRNYQSEVVTFAPTTQDYVIWLMGVSYVQFIGIKFDGIHQRGANADKVVKLSYSGDGTDLCHHIRFSNCEVMNGLHGGFKWDTSPLVFSTFFEAISCLIHNNGSTINLDHGFYISSSDNLVESIEIYNNAAFAAHLYLQETHTDAVSRNVYRSNIVHNNSATGGSAPGLGVFNGNDNIVEDNTIYSEYKGISVDCGASNTINRHNKIYNRSINCFQIGADAGAGIKFYDNITYNSPAATVLYADGDCYFYNNSLYGLNYGVINGIDAPINHAVNFINNIISACFNYYYGDIAGNCKTVLNNWFFDASTGNKFIESGVEKTWATFGKMTGAGTSDPLWTNPAGGDFTLQTASPCIYKGIDVGITTGDFTKKARVGSAFDIGVYEYGTC